MTDAVEQISALERRRIALINVHDLDALREILSDDYVHVHATGKQETREQLIEGWRSKPRRSERLELQVRLYGDVAVAVGLQSNQMAGSHAISKGRTTQVFRRDGEDWRLVSFQMTLVPDA